MFVLGALLALSLIQCEDEAPIAVSAHSSTTNISTSSTNDGLTYTASYINLNIAGTTANGSDFALVAGTHDALFPYRATDRPWDNGLLWVMMNDGQSKDEVEGRGYHFTDRAQQGRAHAGFAREHRNKPVRRGRGRAGTIRYEGEMAVAGKNQPSSPDGQPDGAHVSLELELDYTAALQDDEYLLGIPSLLRGLVAFLPGMRWRPFPIFQVSGTISIAQPTEEEGGRDIINAVIEVEQGRGHFEQGQFRGISREAFSIAYDYVALSAARSNFAYVDFVSQSLYPETFIGWILSLYLRLTAALEITLFVVEGNDDVDESKVTSVTAGNAKGVYRPPPTDSTVVLLENQVDLGTASLRRQLIAVPYDEATPTTTASIRLYGLREIFEAKH